MHSNYTVQHEDCTDQSLILGSSTNTKTRKNPTLQPMLQQILIVVAALAIATVTITTTTTTTHSPKRNETIAVYFINLSLVETKI